MKNNRIVVWLTLIFISTNFFILRVFVFSTNTLQNSAEYSDPDPILITTTRSPNFDDICLFVPLSKDSPFKESIRKTWGENAFFVYGSPKSRNTVSITKKEIHLRLEEKESYKRLSEKVINMWKLLSKTQHRMWGHCKWFFKLDDDTFPNMEFIRSRLECLDHTKEIYTGQLRGHWMTGRYAVIQGAFYGVSSALLGRLQGWIEEYFKQDPFWMFGGEDTNFAYMTQNYSLKPHPLTSLFPLQDKLNLDYYKGRVLSCRGWLHKLMKPDQHTILQDRMKVAPPIGELEWCIEDESGWWVERSELLQDMQTNCNFTDALKKSIRQTIRTQERNRLRMERRKQKG